uniref:Uncharacterized protein n=1 Tax=Mantoniella antarctica TaxID=81844 RepID=A0A7S0X6J2_9CHLO|mmetsp:Transcript_21115/g.52183  ORF Transcript_21115/g.52183 Transcript_21115/m.52183 type:complete len:147 (+) Transcript_21115:121-561(+)
MRHASELRTRTEAVENTIVKKEHDPRPPEWCLGGIKHVAATEELESALDLIRTFQTTAAAVRGAKEREEQLLWTDARRQRFTAQRVAAREEYKQVHFGRDSAGTNGPDGSTFNVRGNLGDLDGIGKFLEQLHTEDRRYPYRIPEGW